MSDGFVIREAALCAELGCTLEELRRRRQVFLVEGVHWAYVKKRVLLSSVGALILRGTWGAELPLPGEKNAPAGDVAPAAPVKKVDFKGELEVWSVAPINPRLVIAFVPGTDPQNPLNLVSVMVRENGNFVRGMKVPGPGRKLHRLREDVFELQGQCPRWRGRW